MASVTGGEAMDSPVLLAKLSAYPNGLFAPAGP